MPQTLSAIAAVAVEGFAAARAIAYGAVAAIGFSGVSFPAAGAEAGAAAGTATSFSLSTVLFNAALIGLSFALAPDAPHGASSRIGKAGVLGELLDEPEEGQDHAASRW